jgi:hypothetical protein
LSLVVIVMTDITNDLRGAVSILVEKAFRRDGFVHPVWFAVTRDGRHLIVPPPVKYSNPESKDLATSVVRAFFTINDVVSYVYAAESWYLDCHQTSVDMKVVNKDGIKDHPLRREVIVIMSETYDSGVTMAFRNIIRPKKGKAKLGPLVVQSDWNQIEGRMSSMLPVRGRAQ